ncbi:MAG: hypothetical protein P3B76_02315 [Gemmatimonadota bacterium]|nr:hypothetical protein [Gemmatimonadota bacterium]
MSVAVGTVRALVGANRIGPSGGAADIGPIMPYIVADVEQSLRWAPDEPDGAALYCQVCST